MLVLSRKAGEKILIGNDIVVTVVRLAGGRVKLGVECPRSRRVMREELDQLQVSGVEVVDQECMIPGHSC